MQAGIKQQHDDKDKDNDDNVKRKLKDNYNEKDKDEENEHQVNEENEDIQHYHDDDSNDDNINTHVNATNETEIQDNFTNHEVNNVKEDHAANYVKTANPNLKANGHLTGKAKVLESDNILVNEGGIDTPIALMQFHVDDVRHIYNSSSFNSNAYYVAYDGRNDNDQQQTARKGGEFTEYRISLTTYFQRFKNVVIVIWRRYSEIEKLYTQLNSCFKAGYHFAASFPDFPPKVTFGRFREDLVEYRRQQFQVFFDFISFHPPLYESPEFLAFLIDRKEQPQGNERYLNDDIKGPYDHHTNGQSNNLNNKRKKKGDEQDMDSIRAFASGRYYDTMMNNDSFLHQFQESEMKISFLYFGSMEIEPVLTVARHLAAINYHNVHFIAPENYRQIIEAYKVKFVSISEEMTYTSLNQLRSPSNLNNSAGSSNRVPIKNQYLQLQLQFTPSMLRKIKEEVKGSRLLIFGQGFVETAIGTSLYSYFQNDMKILGLFLFPEHATTQDLKPSLLEDSFHSTFKIEAFTKSEIVYDEISYVEFKKLINEWRMNELNLKKIDVYKWRKKQLTSLNIPISYGISPSLFERPSDWKGFVDVSGFWFLESESQLKNRRKEIHSLASFFPNNSNSNNSNNTNNSNSNNTNNSNSNNSSSNSIINFITAGPKPIFFGFDANDFQDLSHEERSHFFSILVDTLEESNMRGIIGIYSGCNEKISINDLRIRTSYSNSNISNLNLANNFTTNNILTLSIHNTIFPFLWLFSYCQAVIHDGSFEMTSHSLRAGVPLFTIPILHHQRFSAGLIDRIGIGPMSIGYKQLNKKNLGVALKRLTTQSLFKVRSETFSQHLRNEKGNERIIHRIEILTKS